MDKYAKYLQLQDEAWLRTKYVNEGLSAPQIAAILGCTAGNVEYHMRRFGIQARGRHYGHWKQKQCSRCGTAFTPSGSAARFCSAECRAGTAECQQCGKTFALRPAKRTTGAVYPSKFCSKYCWRMWQSVNHKRTVEVGGYISVRRPATYSRVVSPEGYVRVNLGAGTPGVTRSDGRVLEHRLVMEELLGRPLTPHETIHHINGDKADNRPENLQLRQGKHGTGVRFQCGDCGSHNIVAVPLT